MTMQDKIEQFFSPCISLVETSIDRFRPVTVKDICLLYQFAPSFTGSTIGIEQIDGIMQEISIHGYSLETIWND